MLRRYLSDGQKELEALHALEDLLERTERPRSECLAPSTLVLTTPSGSRVCPAPLQGCCVFCSTSCLMKGLSRRRRSRSARALRSRAGGTSCCGRSQTSSTGSANKHPRVRPRRSVAPNKVKMARLSVALAQRPRCSRPPGALQLLRSSSRVRRHSVSC